MTFLFHIWYVWAIVLYIASFLFYWLQSEQYRSFAENVLYKLVIRPAYFGAGFLLCASALYYCLHP